MKSANKDPIESAVQRASTALEQNLSATGATLEDKVTSIKKKLPRKIRRSANAISEIEKRAKHQPYLLESQKKTLLTAEKQIEGFSKKEETKEDRKASRGRWFTSLILNYLIFLLILAGFWYIATQM